MKLSILRNYFLGSKCLVSDNCLEPVSSNAVKQHDNQISMIIGFVSYSEKVLNFSYLAIGGMLLPTSRSTYRGVTDDNSMCNDAHD